MRTVALATCAEVPELDEDGPALVAALLVRHERVGPKLAAGAILVVAGGVLIGLGR